MVPLLPGIPVGQGFADVQVINADQGFTQSNLMPAQLLGLAENGIPSLTAINGTSLAPTSLDPDFATANVETVLLQNSMAALGGSGFDTANGVAIDVFTSSGKLPTTFLNPGDPHLGSNSVIFTIPSTAPTGPGSIVVSNAGLAKSFKAKSNAVSVPIGARIAVTSVTEAGGVITVKGAGFSAATVINFFNKETGGVVNLGGLKGATAQIPLTLVDPTQFSFVRPAAAIAGPSYVQALNPPFLPFTSSGNAPGGAFTVK